MRREVGEAISEVKEMMFRGMGWRSLMACILGVSICTWRRGLEMLRVGKFQGFVRHEEGTNKSAGLRGISGFWISKSRRITSQGYIRDIRLWGSGLLKVQED